ncbi:hypothetical protein [Limnovirga soli]|uniref:Major tail protein n=1 Tax=Limnovirga soli TaxID=2656915 RepID=A0A8J8FIS3_9BACT|nr:hypothetical protein [Limnovirga soli]NNV57382.1 hypothetical protein [Limnovirga soli]
MSNLYKAYGKGDVKNADGGYKPLIKFAPIDTFLTIAPTVGTTALGDTKKISTAHTFGVDDGFIDLLCKQHSVTAKSTTIGDDGASSLQHTFEGEIIGDGAVLMEELEKQLNDQCMYLVKDADCINATDYVQFGDDCVQPTIKLEFDGKTTKDGLKKVYKITGTIIGHKYFYSGAVTDKPAE